MGEGGSFEVRREVMMSIGDDDESGVDDWRLATTDDEGRFEFGSVPPQDWEVSAQADGFAKSEAVLVELDAAQLHDGVRVSLVPAGDLAGLVLDADGAPVAGAEVLVKPVAQPGQADPQLAGLPPGLAAMLGGGADGQESARSDGAGRFVVKNLLPGDYDVSLNRQGGMRVGGAFMVINESGSGQGMDETTQRVTVLAAEEVFVELIKPATATLVGRVLAAGRPVDGARVSLKEADSFMPFGGLSAEADELGYYRFDDVEPGSYEVSSIVTGAALPEKAEVDLVGGREETQDIVFDGATVAGRVVDADSGEGVAGVTVNVIPVRSASAGPRQQNRMAFAFMSAGPGGGGGGMQMDIGGGSLSKVRSGPDGVFEVRFLDAGKYMFETQGGGYTKAEEGPVELKDERELDGVVIEAVRGAVLSGVVVDGDTGQPLDSAPVALSSMSGGPPEMSLTQGGRYLFEGLEAGDYTVSVQGSGFGGPPLATEVVTLAQGEERALDLTTRDPGPNMPGSGGVFFGGDGGREVTIDIDIAGPGNGDGND